MNWERNLGEWGENMATRFLKEKGLRLVERHFQTPRGEIDLICRHRDTLVFVEVKTRTQAYQPSAADALTFAKQKRLIGTALMYLKKNRITNQNVRFDVITIEGDHIEWIPNAFDVPPYYTF